MAKRISEEEVRKAFEERHHGQPMDEENLQAFFRLGDMLRVSMEGTYLEIKERIIAKLRKHYEESANAAWN